MTPADPDLEVRDEGSYRAALNTLGEARLPARLLSRLMNSLEGYRAARKLGWSRPWNKYGVTTFLALRLDPAGVDRVWLDPLLDGLVSPRVDGEAARFCTDLRADPLLMGFLFLQENEVDGMPCEGITLSLGRKVQRRYRDRLDLRFDLPRNALEEATALRCTLYVDPWRDDVTPPLLERRLDPAPGLAEAFDRLSALGWQWHSDTSRIWDHWTSRYIDYFGPRRQLHSPSHLPMSGGERLPSLQGTRGAA